MEQQDEVKQGNQCIRSGGTRADSSRSMCEVEGCLTDCSVACMKHIRSSIDMVGLCQ